MDEHDMSDNPYRELVGSPSDDCPAILATGRCDITTIFVSMSRRHARGYDADYLRWHSLDHRPEQYRLASLRSSIRLVSTPECRDARAADDPGLTDVDHVMLYFFAGNGVLEEFNDLAVALNRAGRSPFVMPPVARGVYSRGEGIAEPRIKAGVDVLPWLPIRGMYLLIERSEQVPPLPAGIKGVAGALNWTAVETEISSVEEGQRLTLCFLDEPPVDVAREIRPHLEQRWRQHNIEPLLAAPFHCVVPYEWDRYLPW